MKTYKILIVISHSSGELDVLFPLISAVKERYNVKIEFIFAVKKIYEQFIQNNFYLFCSKELDCKITFLRLPNKFDDDFRRLMNFPGGGKLLFVCNPLLLLLKFPMLLRKIISTDIYMHESSNQLNTTRFLYWGQKIFGKKILVYSHGHSFTIDSKATRKVPNAEKVLLLNFHEHNMKYMYERGFTNQYIIGYPKFYQEWIQLLKRYHDSKSNRGKSVLVYSRGTHPFYMDKEKYVKLLTSTYKVVREKMGNITIVIKPHPREDIGFIKRIIDQEKMENVCISWEHAGVLAQDAVLAISFWTSAILDSLSLGIPSVEYYIEADRFREIEPEGSAYKKLGIHTVDNEKDLGKFMGKVLSGDYKQPDIIYEISQHKDVEFLETINK